jgi:trehalose 6-phosphate phosphatase
LRPESSNDPGTGPIGPSPRAAVLAAAALAPAPAGVLTDLDGTLAPIVADPAAARLAAGAAAALAHLAQGLAVVGVITGRAAADARRILGSDALLVVGNHGLEWLEPGADTAQLPPGGDALAAAVEHALRAVPQLAGVAVERKGLSATIHVRGAPDPSAALAAIEAALRAAEPDGVELRTGRMSLEVRPADAGNKGSALRAVVERHGLRGLLVLGDDVTDLDMFRAAAELRAAGTLTAAIVAVRGGPEVPARVAAAADTVLDSPAEVVRLLEELAG